MPITKGISTPTYESIYYTPGLQDTGDLEGATKTILAVAEAVGLGSADYSKTLTLPTPSDARLIINQIKTRLSVTIDSDDGTHDLRCRVYVDAQDADHMLFDESYVATGNQISAQGTDDATKAVIFNLLKDGAAHTFYFFFWTPGGHAPVISVVQAWEGVGAKDNGWNNHILKLSFIGEIMISVGYWGVVGGGTASSHLMPLGIGNPMSISTLSGDAGYYSIVKNPTIRGKISVSTDLGYLTNVNILLKSGGGI